MKSMDSPKTKAGDSLKTKVALAPFQQAWVKDDSRFKIYVKARRIGVTFATTLEIARDCIKRRTRWLIISRTQDTAKEAVREIANHFKAMQIIERVEDSGLRLDEIKISKFVIELPNGSEVTGMTAHPDAARGFGGNVFLDEHAFHRDSQELWKGAAASVMRGHRLIVVSTPHYQLGNFFKLARTANLIGGFAPDEKQGIWSAHWTDLPIAAPQLCGIKVPPFWIPPVVDEEGNEITPGHENISGAIAEVRELAGDDETWNQEFLCQFLSASEMLIPLELIAAARSPQATADWNPDASFEGSLYIGIDFGRKRDLTAVWIDERVADVAIQRGLVTMRNMSTTDQFRAIEPILSHPRVKRCCLDYTGPGIGLGDMLYEKFGYKVELITFNNEIKQTMALQVRRRMEEKLDKIPRNVPSIENAFTAIKREITASGMLRFDAARTEAGHSDEFWAKALADLAADSGVAAAGGWNVEQADPAGGMFQDRANPFGDDIRPVSVWDDAREPLGQGMFG